MEGRDLERQRPRRRELRTGIESFFLPGTLDLRTYDPRKSYAERTNLSRLSVAFRSVLVYAPNATLYRTLASARKIATGSALK